MRQLLMDSTPHGAHLTPTRSGLQAVEISSSIAMQGTFRSWNEACLTCWPHICCKKEMWGGRTGQGEQRLRVRKLSHQGQQNQEKTKNVDCKNFLRLGSKRYFLPKQEKQTRFGIRRYIYYTAMYFYGWICCFQCYLHCYRYRLERITQTDRCFNDDC